MKTITLTREQLYAQVWHTPMRTLAHRYALSDVGLAKVCKRHNVPRPPVGYWAQKEVGKAPPQPPLPSWKDPAGEEIVLFDGPRPTPEPAPPPLAVVYDDDVVELLSRAATLPKQLPADTLRNMHALVRATKERLEDHAPDEHNMLWSTPTEDGDRLQVHVSKDVVRRALLFMDTLVKAVEQVGGAVKIIERKWHGRRVTVWFAGQDVATLRLRERYKLKNHEPEPGASRWARRRQEHVPTGLLVLDAVPNYFEKPHCQDSEKGKRIEDAINDMILLWIRKAGDARIAFRQAEEAARRHQEEERVRKAQAADVERRRNDLQQRQKAEQARVDRLLANADAWYRSRRLRRYIRTIEQQAIRDGKQTDATSELGQGLMWARHQADRLDPLAPTPPSILDEPLP